MTALTTASRLTRSGVQRLLTAADVAALPDDLPSGKVKYELYDGRLVIMPLPGARHSVGQLRVGSYLFVQGELRGFGKAFSEVGVILGRGPDTVVGPDAAFVTKKSFPIRESAEGYLETIPELIVEVRSKNDSKPKIERKIERYHDAGVHVVWLLDPAKKSVTICPKNGRPKTLGPEVALTANSIIPGFRVTVRDLFAN